MMTEAERLAQANTLMNTPLWLDILAGMERDAIDHCVTTKDDHERFAWAAEVRAIRNLRGQLHSIIEEAKPSAQAFQPV